MTPRARRVDLVCCSAWSCLVGRPRETPVCRAVLTRTHRPAPRRGLLAVQRKIEARASALPSVLLRCCQVSGFVPCASFPTHITNEFSRAAARRSSTVRFKLPSLPPSKSMFPSVVVEQYTCVIHGAFIREIVPLTGYPKPPSGWVLEFSHRPSRAWSVSPRAAID